MATRQGKNRGRPDSASYAGVVVALLGILGGYLLEHGSAGDVLGTSAALIVFGGCLGATLLANPLPLVIAATKRLKDVFTEPPRELGPLVEEIVGYSVKARKNGIVSLEHDVLEIPDAFLRKALMLAVDGVDLQEVRSTMELEIDTRERRAEREASVYESAGGYAPTIGIIGAVLGLIIVMGKIEDTRLVGKGIAAAFVATIYGVGSANLFFLPAAHKIKMRAQAERERQELIVEGVSGLVEGLNPKLIRGKLDAYLPAADPPAAAEAKSPPQSARVPAES